MASDLFSKWLAHYDTIHRGYTPSGIANGLTATSGSFFPRIRGGYNLYRGVAGAGSIDFDHAVGAADRDATTISNFAWRPHAVSTDYSYAIKAIGGGGVESAASSPSPAAEFDGAGALVGPRPNGPTEMSVRPAAGGTFELRWVYATRFQEAEPARFELFHDGGSGSVDYNTVVAQVAFVSGRAHYRYMSGAFAHGARRIWGLRAVTGAGVIDGNVLEAFAWADAAAPEAHPGIRLACLAQEEEPSP